MAFKNVRNDFFPLRAGFQRITPLDANGNPERSKAYSTKRAYVQSITVNTARTSETVPNGNGQDGEYPLDETQNMAIAMNTFDPKYHAIVSGMEYVASPAPVLRDTTIVPTAGSEVAEYTFPEDEYAPVAQDDEKFYFEIRDSYGNLLEQTDGESTEDKFKYESMSRKLTFASKYVGIQLSCVYYYAATNGEGYKTPSTPSNKQFMIETGGELVSASTGEVYTYYSCMTKGAISGDLPNVTTQKSKNNTITYNFKSMPVPEGVSGWYQSITPKDAGLAAAAAAVVPEKKSAAPKI